MSSNVTNAMPFMRTSREFPQDISMLVLELSRSYLETASSVNNRVIGVFAANRPSITGETWFFTASKQQTLRQIYRFTSTSSIPHGINVSNISSFTRCFGEFTDGTNWYGLIHGTSVAIAGQRSFYITPTNIVFVAGGGAPALTSGLIVLEWLSDN